MLRFVEMGRRFGVKSRRVTVNGQPGAMYLDADDIVISVLARHRQAALERGRSGARRPPSPPSLEAMPDPLTDEELAFLQGVLDMAREGRTAELADVVERGVPVNLTGGTGDSLLILAAYHGHPETVRMLLEHGADPDRVNDRGQTALGAAVFRQSEELVRVLLDHGADPRAGGRSAVDVAAFFGLDAMSALLSP